MKQLDGKVAIITGASSGIGRAAAELFSAEGASVVLGARRHDELSSLTDAIREKGGKACFLAGDVQDEAYAISLVEVAEQEFDGLDIAFNNAGTMGAMGPVADVSAKGWHETINTNLTAAFFGAKHQLPAMERRGSGSLIFTTSFVGVSRGISGMAAYAASKAGLVGLTQSLATEYGEKSIRVNALVPGGTLTDMAPDTKEGCDFAASTHAMKRLANPEEIASAALFLASDASSFTTGHTLMAEGGVSIQWG